MQKHRIIVEYQKATRPELDMAEGEVVHIVSKAYGQFEVLVALDDPLDAIISGLAGIVDLLSKHREIIREHEIYYKNKHHNGVSSEGQKNGCPCEYCRQGRLS